MADNLIPGREDKRLVFRDLLEEKCVSLAKLARKLGYTPSYLSMVLGQKERLSDRLRGQLNEFLGTNL